MPMIEGKNVDIVDAHVSTIKQGDTVYHNGSLITVSRSDVSRVEFFGLTLFGDSYHLGHKPVKKALFKKAKP